MAFDPQADAERALHACLAGDCRQHPQRCHTRFGDFDAGAAPVFVLPSLWRLDAPGTAAWVGEQLHPGAPLRQVLLDDDALSKPAAAGRIPAHPHAL